METTQKRYPACIMATCCVPWDEQFRLDEPLFRQSVRTMLGRTRHLYVFGTAGEGYAVSDRLFDQVVKVFADEMRLAGAEPMVGVISLSLSTIVERIERCRDWGVQQFQISLPCWGVLNDLELLQFFDHVCGRFDDCLFMHYNLLRSKRLLSVADYAVLADRHPNLVATKNTSSSEEFVTGLVRETPQLQHFLSERGYVWGSMVGECGLLASLVTAWPILRNLFEAGTRRDPQGLKKQQQLCSDFLQALFATVPEGRIDGAYDKLFAKILDPSFPLRLLPPYCGSSDKEFEAFVEVLRNNLPEWLPSSATDGV